LDDDTVPTNTASIATNGLCDGPTHRKALFTIFARQLSTLLPRLRLLK